MQLSSNIFYVKVNAVVIQHLLCEGISEAISDVNCLSVCNITLKVPGNFLEVDVYNSQI